MICVVIAVDLSLGGHKCLVCMYNSPLCAKQNKQTNLGTYRVRDLPPFTQHSSDERTTNQPARLLIATVLVDRV